MSLQVHNLSYMHPDRDVLFQNISFSVSSGDKCAIVGNNGIGKSTLLKIIAGTLTPSSRNISCESLYMIPQHFGQYDGMSVAEILGVSEKLRAMSAILDGVGTEDDFLVLNDEWDIQERITDAFSRWHIDYIEPDRIMSTLSGGEKTRVFLAGLDIHTPSVVLMDEPTNHLDIEGRGLLYDFIRNTNKTIVIVSHDRMLLNMLTSTYEMSQSGMRFFPMNYDEYKTTIDAETESRVAQLENRQKELAKAEKSARKTMERQQKHATRGEKQNAKKGVARIVMGNLRDKSETTTSRLNKVQQEKLGAMNREMHEIRATITEHSAVKITIGSSVLPDRKLLVEAKDITFAYKDGLEIWGQSPLNLSIFSGERIWLQGNNGCGKSTLLKLITGDLEVTEGEMWRMTPLHCLYLDQEYSCIDNELTVYEQLQSCNHRKPEHEIKMLLHRFLFTATTWDKKCRNLSGGEKMKLALCGLLAMDNAPDIIIADEPTNNIDIQSMDVLAEALGSYQGTLIVVSHDERFVRDVGIERVIKI